MERRYSPAIMKLSEINSSEIHVTITDTQEMVLFINLFTSFFLSRYQSYRICVIRRLKEVEVI